MTENVQPHVDRNGDKIYSKTCLKWPLKKDQNLFFKTDCRLMQVKRIAECSLSSTCIKLPYVFETFILSIFEWPLKTGFVMGLSAVCVIVVFPDHTHYFFYCSPIFITNFDECFINLYLHFHCESLLNLYI